MHITIVSLFVLAEVISIQGISYKASVYVSGSQLQLLPGVIDDQATAYGSFKDDLLVTGWGVLDIKSGYGNQAKDIDIMKAAGILEGFLTAKHMWNHYQNMYNEFFTGKSNDAVQKVKDFFIQQSKWTVNMVTKSEASDPYWRHVSFVMAQYSGLYTGYVYVAQNQSDWVKDIFLVALLNGVGDLLDLIKALDKKSMPNFSNMTTAQLMSYANSNGHCSALVKVTGAFEDLFMAHSSWFSYSATNRIYKHYDFNISDTSTNLKKMSFPSYPGFLESLDDFYALGGEMVMMSTTNNIYNTTLYKHVSPQSLLTWQRVRVTNMMATSGEQWYLTFKKYNSGTYNNQYMVIDLSKVHLNQEIQDGAMWVVEQIPGLIVGMDQTAVLRAGYWPSYNIPFYEEIYTLSGYPSVVEKHGKDFSYQLAPRAKIFRRDQGNVINMDTFKDIMRYNDYTTDPYSGKNPCSTICCRGDLNTKSPSADGCYDTKVTNFSMAQQLQVIAINGPTQSHNLKPFAWTGEFDKVSHVGLPNEYDFEWVEMKPSL